MVPEGGRAQGAKSAHGNLFRTSLKLGHVTEVTDGLREQRVVWDDELHLPLCRAGGGGGNGNQMILRSGDGSCRGFLRAASLLSRSAGQLRCKRGFTTPESVEPRRLWSGEEEESRPCLNPWRGCVTDSFIRHSPKPVIEQC